MESFRRQEVEFYRTLYVLYTVVRTGGIYYRILYHFSNFLILSMYGMSLVLYRSTVRLSVL
jgi:hypothetical protein